MNSELSSTKRTGPHWLKFAAASLLAVAIAGCGGGGSTGANSTTQTTAMTPAQWADAQFKGQVTSATVPAASGTPVVNFKVTDAAGKPVVGLANTTKSATALFASYPNVALSIAKLVPSADGSPSKWVSYVVTSINSTTGAVTAGRPSTDNTGTLVDNGDGSYKYTFYRDITKVKEVIDGLTYTSPNKASDLGDLTYAPNLTHRVAIQISGNARGTGTNTADGSNSGITAVRMENPLNLVYDFIPATGAAVTAADAQRNVVATAKCNECHDKLNALGFHGGARNEPGFCVTCHTDQRKYGRTASTSDANGVFTGSTYLAGGLASGDFPNMIHKIHMGNRLAKTGYNYANVLFDKVIYTQEVTNCTKCHDGSATSTAVTTQGDNWKTAPSVLACGSCHDGIDFVTGLGTTVSGATTGHFGGAVKLSDDKACAGCHLSGVSGMVDNIAVVHAGVNATPHNPIVPAGLTNFTYDVKTVTVNTDNQPVVTFRILQQTPPATTATPVVFNGTSSASLLGFTGNPSFMIGYAAAQDGITAPVDFNNLGKSRAQPATVTIGSLLATLGAPDANGYYTVALTAPAAAFPVGAKLRTIALQGYYTQAAGTNGIAANTARHTLSSVKAVSGEERRAIIEPAKCGNCHEVFEGHGGNRNIGKNTVGATTVCVICHNPGIVTSGRGMSDAALSAFPFTAANLATLTSWGVDKDAVDGALKFPQVTNNLKDMIHGIHAGKARTNPIRIARDRTPNAINLIDGATITFPGILNNCETCHKAGTYSNVPANALLTTQESDNGVFLNGVSRTTADAKAALTQPNALDVVTTPFSAACVSCHDTSAALAHMKSNGGQILVTRNVASTTGESCSVCHGTGKVADAAVAHK